MNYNEQVFILLETPRTLSMLHLETQLRLSLQSLTYNDAYLRENADITLSSFVQTFILHHHW